MSRLTLEEDELFIVLMLHCYSTKKLPCPSLWHFAKLSITHILARCIQLASPHVFSLELVFE